MRKKEKHSEAFLGKYRDFWWNHDFLDLMAKRWDLRKANSMADIGCGLGHWSRLLFQYLKPKTRLVGVDLEKNYIKRAPIEFHRAYPKAKKEQYSFLVGDAMRLPLSSDSFDVVTCQTLLIHLKNPEIALTEMIRVAKPGGLITCSEPSGIVGELELSSLTHQKSVESFVKYFEYILRYQRGKMALGEGDNSFGDLLPGLFAKLGLVNIKVYQSDKPSPLFPPYRDKEQRILLDQMMKWKREGTGGWDPKLSKRRVLAGGGSKKFFSSMWRAFEKDFKDFRSAVRQEKFHGAGGSVSYLVSARKK